jgi:hypothetical protein
MNDQPLKPGGKGSLNPLTILKDAIRTVPSMKYALAVLGLVATVAIVTVWRVKYEVAIFGAVIILALMVPVLVLAKLTKVAPKYFLGPARAFMWAFVLLTIVAGTCLFTTAAFRQPAALYELIFNKPVRPVPSPVPQPNRPPPEFVAQVVYRTNMIERTEFATEPGQFSPEKLDEFLTLRRVAYGTADKTNRVFQVNLAIKNTSSETILLDLNERFFSMTDDNGRNAELIYFCCASKGGTLAPGEERIVNLFVTSRVGASFALADQLELCLAEARGQAHRLTPSLLARPFPGQLVFQAEVAAALAPLLPALLDHAFKRRMMSRQRPKQMWGLDAARGSWEI